MHDLAAAASAAPDFAAVYRAHHGFVWRTLRHLGVDPGRVDDALQDTFMVVHTRLGEFAGRAALRTWLFEIARRVAARYRRTAAREAPRLCVLDEVPGPTRVDDSLELAEAAEILRVFLDELDRDKSVVFILSELEQWRAPEIAEALELNLNTVYARLRAARKQLDRVVGRLQARERRPRRAAEIVAAAVIAVPPPAPPIAAPGTAVAISHAAVHTAATATKLGIFAAGSVALAVAIFTGPPPTSPPAPTPAAIAAPSPPPARIASTPTPAPIVAPVTAPPRDDPLAAELALLESARAALLAEDPRRALVLLTRHARRFRDGALAQEVAITRVEAHCRLDDRAAAQREAAAFARRWSASAAWIADPCEG